jgi:hypothetical protein
VSAKLYAAQNRPGGRHLDRDKDGVARETSLALALAAFLTSMGAFLVGVMLIVDSTTKVSFPTAVAVTECSAGQPLDLHGRHDHARLPVDARRTGIPLEQVDAPDLDRWGCQRDQLGLRSRGGRQRFKLDSRRAGGAAHAVTPGRG